MYLEEFRGIIACFQSGDLDDGERQMEGQEVKNASWESLVCISLDFSLICRVKSLNDCSLTFNEVVSAYMGVV